jgi:RNA polymerase sigma-70 factor (ECF subfamily)
VNQASAQRFGQKLTAAAPDRHANVNELADFDAVYRNHVSFVWRTLRGMGVPDAAVEDAVQEVFVVVHRRLGDFDGRHAVRTWLFAIVYRVACEQRRKLRRTRTQEPLEPQLRDGALSPYESAERAQELRVAVALLDALDNEKRAVIVLADIEGMTAPEIAKATGVGLNTVYTRLRRARLQLNKLLSTRGTRKS